MMQMSNTQSNIPINYNDSFPLKSFFRLKTWTESLENVFKIEIEDILFPVFISLYRKLNSSGNAAGARNFYTRHQSNFFKIPEYRKMAEKFCSETKR